MNRQSWFEAFAQAASKGAGLSPRTRRSLLDIDDTLFKTWDLGDNLILAWTRVEHQLRFLAVRHYAIFEMFGYESDGNASREADNPVIELLAGPKHLDPAEFERVCQRFGGAAQIVDARIETDADFSVPLVDGIVTRYGVSLVRNRAVLLLDVVGFSLRAPLDQLAMLNSLNYSINSACRQLHSRDVHIDFARTTTGDGFYIWNRALGPQATIALYELMMLILADNAVAQRKARHFPVPRLRAAFHVGDHYEFYQVEGLNPTAFGYIVGQVTVDLARLIEKTLPGQIVLGEFTLSMDPAGSGPMSGCDTRMFVEQAAARIEGLKGLAVADDQIDDIRCYLTGPREGDGSFGVDRYAILDKHDTLRYAYNAKINIHLLRSSPIFLGIQCKDADRFAIRPG